ncbi:sodium-dependent bicarbonate transport family permease [Porticoccaceae bacterium]|nr:sodium-dependent bicarbonate transport family permease [Porticoccaceae bacterium]
MSDPIILFFIFGVFAGLVRSELRLPSAIYDFLSLTLLLAIGLKGGIELAKQPFLTLAPQIAAVFLMGLLLPLVAFPLLRLAGKLNRADAASIAAHYGSVSVGTFAVAIAYMNSRGISYEEHISLLLVVLEIPAILVGILLARGLSKQTRWGTVAHEIFAGKGVILLLGGLAIGWIAGPAGVEPIAPFFFGLFKGVLALFLLEMGVITASKLGSLRRYGLFIVLFGIGMPLFSALIGASLGILLGFSTGGVSMLATLAASASYIAVPAAMRISVPEANPTLSLSASLGVTFPFNVLVGIPLYYDLAVRLQTSFGA